MVPDLPLVDGTALPALGFGLYKVPRDQTADVVHAGIDAGYRLIDGAAFYGNERELGEAVRASGVRDRLTVTTKLWGEASHERDAVLREFEASFTALGLDRIDLYLIHWPRPSKGRYVDVWRTLAELRAAGRIRSIGVANFSIDELERIIGETGVVPVVNQVETHPWLQQHELRAFHARHGIVTQAWSPLGRGRLLDDPVLARIARRHAVSVAQVVLRWHVQLGGGAVPKSAHPARLRENLDVDTFALDAGDLASIAALDTGIRTGTHPDERR